MLTGAHSDPEASGGADLRIRILAFVRDKTLAYLRSLYEQAGGTSFEVIVVDNASADGSADAIAQAFPQARLIALNENVGFAAANNLAAREAAGKYLLLLNPDTVIMDRAIERIVTFAQKHPSARVYGGRTFFADMSLNRNLCHGQPTPWSLFCMGMGLSALFRRSRFFNPEQLGRWERDSVRAVDCITGCFLLIDRALWQTLGGFDLDFFMYGEDTDLCIRARKAGATCLVDPDAKLVHYGGRSERVRADKMVRLFTAKRQLFEKHWSPVWVPFGIAMLKAWAGTRAFGQNVRCTVGLGDAKAAEAWGEVWRRRSEYAVARAPNSGASLNPASK